MRQRAATRSLLLVPSLLFVGLYLPTLDYDFVWTDRGEILFGTIRVPVERLGSAFTRPMSANLPPHLADSAQSYYRPLQVVLVSSIHHAVGDSPAHFRALNLVLGGVTVALVSWLALLLLGDLRGALLCGAIFALHPVNLENYIWIAGLSQSLASFFGVSSLLAGLWVRQAPEGRRRALASAVSVSTLVLALLSKESAAVLPAMLLAAYWLLESPHRGGDARSALPARGLLIAHVVVALLFFGVWRPLVMGSALTSVPPLDGDMRIQTLTAVASWPRALAWLLLPWESSTSDVVRVVTSFWNPRFLLGLGLLAASFAAVRRLERSGLAVAALALAWLWIAFLPTSGLVPLTHLRGERYLAPSLLGLALCVAAGWVHAQARLRAPSRRVVTALAVGLALLLAERSWHRSPDWRSDRVLFAADVARDPLYREGYHELAKAYVQEGDLDAAKRTIDALLGLGPGFAGHFSFLREADVAVLQCHLNLSLRAFSDNERYVADVRITPESAAREPLLGFCAALSLRSQGEEAAALAALEALYAAAHPLLRAKVPIEAAAIHARGGRVAQTRTWLARVPADARLEPSLAARRRALSEWAAGAGATAPPPREG